MRYLGSILLALCALPLTSCQPRDAFGTELVKVSTVRGAVAGTFYAKLSWKYGTSDGKGTVDSVVTSGAVDPGNLQAQQHRLPATVTADSFLFASTFGAAMTGQVCVKSKRRALESGNVCKAWSYTEPDAPPPPPVIDSTPNTVKVTIALPTQPLDSIGTDQMLRLFPVVKFADGHYARYSQASPEAVTAFNLKYTAAQRAITATQQAIADSEVAMFTYVVESWPTGGVVPPGVEIIPIQFHEVYFHAPNAGGYLVLGEGRKKTLGWRLAPAPDFKLSSL